MKNILVPTDFSLEAHHAYEVALQLAHRTGGNLTLLHVLEAPEAATANFSTFGGPVSGGELPNGNGGMDQLFMLQLLQATKRRMHRLKDEAATVAADVLVLDVVELAGVGDGILAAIEKHAIDLVVMGAQGHSALENFFVSSTTERLIRLAPCPVLTVKHRQPHFDVRTILFPSDFSSEAQAAFSGLQQVLTTFPHATLHLLHVAADGDNAIAKHHMQAFATRHQLTNYHVVVIEAERVAAGIEQYAQQVRADLVVLPTHHYSGLSRFLHASIAEVVATHALPPVLTYHFAASGMPANEAARAAGRAPALA